MKNLVLTGFILALAAVAQGAAADVPPDVAAKVAEARKLVAGLKYQTGDIVVQSGLAKISVPANFRYLDSANAETLLTKIWGNPSGNGTLGMIVPANFDPFADASWAVVVTYDEDGHVKDDDAAKLDYNKLLSDMRDGMKDENAQREKAGYPSISLVGWAAPPRYDAASHKMYWAKELKFGNSPVNTLNYNIRMLGRKGVLVLNAVADMPQLKDVEAATPAILAMVNFQDGNRYADFVSGTDKVAGYGLAALVVGGVAAKAGFFKLLWVGILALKKFIILAVVAIAGFVKRLFKGRTAKSAFASADPGSPPASPPAA